MKGRIWMFLFAYLYNTVLQPIKARQVHSGFRPAEENEWSCGDA